MIRKLIISDYEEALNIMNEAHQLHLQARPDIYKDSISLIFDEYQAMINDDDFFCYGYFINNKLCGVIFASQKETLENHIIKKQRICFIENISVLSTHQHQGIGKSLYQTIKDIAIKRNNDAIELNVWDFNINAIKFYESIGFNVKNIRMEEKL